MDNRIGAVVARERKALGLTQEELARRLGVTKAAVSKWELGQSMPDAALLPSIAAQFALSIDELFDWRAHLTDAEIETCAQTAREKLAADASQGATYVRMRARASFVLEIARSLGIRTAERCKPRGVRHLPERA